MLRRHHRMVTVLGALAMAGAAVGALATTVGADRNVSDSARALGALGWDDDWKDRGNGKRFAHAKLVNPAGDRIGSVQLSQWDDKVLVVGRVRDIPTGFHGFHIHAVGKCEGTATPPFGTAGGHLSEPGQTHPSHKGDLPSLLADAGGGALLITTTDRFSLSDLRDADGAAVIVHANPDNYANIPKDRYDPDPDEMTLSTGDAGGRIACGVVR